MLEDLGGKYKGSYRDAVRARSIVLNIGSNEDCSPSFALRITDAGQVGSVGTIYDRETLLEKEPPKHS